MSVAEPELVVLFRSDDVLVVDKPAGISTEPDQQKRESLLDRVARLLGPGAQRRAPHAASRLDTNVSGAVTFVLSARAARELGPARAEGRLRRAYVAIVAGALASDAGVWSVPVAGKPARSRYVRVARARGAELVLLLPETGRTHQLRIHCARGGAPIFGDRKYGGPSTLCDAAGRVHALDRVLLHAVALRLELPFPPREQVRAPVPAALLSAWQTLDGAPGAWDDLSASCARELAPT